MKKTTQHNSLTKKLETRNTSQATWIQVLEGQEHMSDATSILGLLDGDTCCLMKFMKV